MYVCWNDKTAGSLVRFFCKICVLCDSCIHVRDGIGTVRTVYTSFGWVAKHRMALVDACLLVRLYEMQMYGYGVFDGERKGGIR